MEGIESHNGMSSSDSPNISVCANTSCKNSDVAITESESNVKEISNSLEADKIVKSRNIADSCQSDCIEVRIDQHNLSKPITTDARAETSRLTGCPTSMEAKGCCSEREAPQTSASEHENASGNGKDSSSSETSSESSENEDEQAADFDKAKATSRQCQVCCSSNAKYTCPRCEFKTCSVPCVKQHKIRSGCSGERDKLAFVDISQYSDQHLLNDYRFLEDAERRLFSNTSVPSSHKRQGLRYTPYISKRGKYLMTAAQKRGIILRFVHPSLTKSKSNTSFFTISTDTIDWHVDWLFSSSNTLVKDERVAETTSLINAVRKFTNFTEYPHLRKSLELYRGEKLNFCYFLLKLDGLPANRTRYVALKPEQTLAENLKGLCLLEYPTIILVPSFDKMALENYPLLSKEDMPEMERDSARHMLKYHPHLAPSGDAERQLLDINSSLYFAPQEKQSS